MRIATLTALATFGLDQASKLAVVQGLNLINRGEIDVLPPFLVFRMAWNRGINFGLFAGDAELVRWGIVAISLVISVWVWLWVRRTDPGRLTQISAGLLVGGALGNVIDRIWYGAVADFLNMSCCGIENPYAFNVADIAIFAGALGLVLFAGRRAPPAKRRARKG
ncbi:signal peptidase II [Pseudogemmobacter humi]|uniref:Lipoprotein signal peptidase n=1 Tax=Pseudogemmobacter humi TaxID=2483812 RepID=A0A3P5XDH1_9RHOB|nr:signal peptidase II [Pseudogemmobacter humi]VDC32747.1 Lipoprotein signal peptidase [Pseudogemmobacter humi]